MEFIFANCGPVIIILSALTAALIWASGKKVIQVDTKPKDKK